MSPDPIPGGAPDPEGGATPVGEQGPASVPSPSGAPPRPRSCMGSIWALLGVVVGGIYILNPTLGLFELLPDNAPGIGNLDEAGAAALLIFGLRYLLLRRR